METNCHKHRLYMQRPKRLRKSQGRIQPDESESSEKDQASALETQVQPQSYIHGPYASHQRTTWLPSKNQAMIGQTLSREPSNIPQPRFLKILPRALGEIYFQIALYTFIYIHIQKYCILATWGPTHNTDKGITWVLKHLPKSIFTQNDTTLSPEVLPHPKGVNFTQHMQF